MGFEWLRSRGVGARVAAGGAIVSVVLAGCTGVPGLALQTSALNIPDKPTIAERKPSAEDTKVARGRLSDAAAIAAARANPGDVEAVMSAARVLRREGDKPGALAMLDSAAAPASNDARLLRDRGLLALELGAVARARDHLQKAVAAGSRDWQTHSGLGAALAASGKPKDAERAFGEALKLAPDNPVILNNMALAMALDGRRGEAEQTLRRAATRGQKESDARVSQNLSLMGRIGERTTKPAENVRPADGAAPRIPVKDAVKDAKKSVAAPTPLQTARAD